MTASTPRQRFREAREHLGLSHEEVAERCGISTSCVWDIESYDDELPTCYSAADLRRFCEVLQIRPVELFGDRVIAPPVASAELVQRIYEECRSREITLQQFEDIVGWKLQDFLQQPDRLLASLSLDGLRTLCREVHIEWGRVLAAL